MRAAEYQVVRLKDPLFRELQTEEDEKFKEQSFGACLGVLVITVLVGILSICLIAIAAKQFKKPVIRPDALITLAPNSDIRNLLPVTLGNLSRGDVAELAQPGTAVPMLHGSYGSGIQIYALPKLGMSSQSLDDFRYAVSAVCSQTNPPLVSQEVHATDAYYAIIGANGGLVGDTSERLVDWIARTPEPQRPTGD